jgi:hypothetical protein
MASDIQSHSASRTAETFDLKTVPSRTAAAKMVGKQMRTTYKGRSSSYGTREGCHLTVKSSMIRYVTLRYGMLHRAEVNTVISLRPTYKQQHFLTNSFSARAQPFNSAGV